MLTVVAGHVGLISTSGDELKQGGQEFCLRLLPDRPSVTLSISTFLRENKGLLRFGTSVVRSFKVSSRSLFV